MLQNELVCGYRDISKEKWAGFSGRHDIGGNAVQTTNGAGPHNMQIFILAEDGTVMHCLPGYWNPKDLAGEVAFAARLHDVWTNPAMDYGQKTQVFARMQLGHIAEHSEGMVARSQLQTFDKSYEWKNRQHTSDTINRRSKYANVAYAQQSQMIPQATFKTTDQIMHERMSMRPFVPYNNFDVVAFSDYGRPKYDKNEDFRGPGGVDKAAARKHEMLGQVPERANRPKRMQKRMAKAMLKQGIRAVLWGMR